MGDGLDLLIDAMPGLLDRVAQGYELTTVTDASGDRTTLVAVKGEDGENTKAPDRIRIDIDPDTYEVRRLVLEWNQGSESDEAFDASPRPEGRGDRRRPRSEGPPAGFDRRRPPPGPSGGPGERRRRPPPPPSGRPGPGRDPLVEEAMRAESQGPERPPARITFERVPASAFDSGDFSPTTVRDG